MEESQALLSLSALAHPSRLKVFRALVVAGPQGTTPGDLCQTLDLPNATLSFHLKELLRTGLTTQQRVGRHLVYRADFDRINGLLSFLTQNCCQGANSCISLTSPDCSR